jgi:hypothetical protein
LECMAGTTGLEPATSAVTGQRSDQLSYVPKFVFNNLDVCHIESSVPLLSLFSLVSTTSLVWTQFRAFLDTKWTPNWTPNRPTQRQDKVYQNERPFGVHHTLSPTQICRFILRFPRWRRRPPRVIRNGRGAPLSAHRHTV